MKKNRIAVVVYFMISILVVLLLNSSNWFQKDWDQIDFATVVYQMTTPLNGTNSEVIKDYCIYVLPRVFLEIILLCFLYDLVKVISNQYYISICISAKNTNKNFLIGKKARKVVLTYCVFTIMCYALLVGKHVKDLGIPEYIKSYFDNSTLFEEQYVDPANVQIAFPEKKRNLLCIYLESMETTYASKDVGGGKPINYIPELTKLAEENVNFSNNSGFGGGHPCSLTEWTMAGILGSTAGIPYKIPGNHASPVSGVVYLGGVTSLGDILEENGYTNYFMCGSDVSFAGKDMYLKQHGDYIIDDVNWALNNNLIKNTVFWGYADETLFKLAKEELTKIATKNETFNFTMITVDTHQPSGYFCSLCNNKYSQQYANVLACSSKQVYDFIMWVQQQKWYDNTTIVLLGDHKSMVADFWDDIGDYDRRTYNCFINVPENVSLEYIKNRDFTTLDMFPTILASLGVKIDGEKLGLGTNIFSGKDTLVEQFGYEYVDDEILKYSDFYNDILLKGNKNK